MANYQNSILTDAIGILSKRFQAHELRPGYFGATEAFFNYRDYSIPNLSDIRLSPQRTSTIKYLTRSNQAAVTARSCTPTAAFGDSGTANLTYATYGFTVKTSEKLADNNYFNRATMFANDLYNGMLDAHEDIETAAVAYLEANKTGVNVGDGWMGTFDTGDDIFNIALADKTRYYNYLATVMRENKYRGALEAVQNVSAGAVMLEQMAQGSSNSTNLNYQFQNILFRESSNVTTASDYLINSYVVDPYAIAVVDWIPPLNRRGFIKGQEEWTVMGDLFGLPIQWSVFKKEACTDTTSIGGDTQDPVTVYECTVDLAFVKAPLTTSTETVIYKFGLKTT
jgi:hypothetical protein